MRRYHGAMSRAENAHGTAVLIDDDSGFLTVLCKRLDHAGWRHVVLAALPPQHDLLAMRPDVVVVNPKLLGPSSWELLQQLGENLGDIGLIVCSEHGTVAQRVRALRLGADDWVAKPCHPEEVVARIEAVTRRHRRAQASEVLDVGPLVHGELEFRVDRYEVLASGRPVELTKREYELLLLLARSDGRVLAREDIYQRVWGYAMARGDRSVDVFVRKVRRKLEAVSPSWRYVHTHFGIGYRFGVEVVDGSAEALTPSTSTGSAVPEPGRSPGAVEV